MLDFEQKYIFHYDSSRPDCDNVMDERYKNIYDGSVCRILSYNGNAYYDIEFYDGSQGNAFEYELELAA